MGDEDEEMRIVTGGRWGERKGQRAESVKCRQEELKSIGGQQQVVLNLNCTVRCR
jgi:hypothetical protein